MGNSLELDWGYCVARHFVACRQYPQVPALS